MGGNSVMRSPFTLSTIRGYSIATIGLLLVLSNIYALATMRQAQGTTLPIDNHAALFVTPGVHQLGSITPATQHQFSFTVSNTGKVPIETISIRSRCSCTLADAHIESLPPGSSKVIHGTFNPKGISGPFRRELLLIVQHEGRTLEHALNVSGIVRGPTN